MTQWLGAFVGLTEDLSSVRSIYMEAYKHPGGTHVAHKHTCRQNTHTHRIKINKSFSRKRKTF